MRNTQHTRYYILSMAIVAATLAACEAPSSPSGATVVASRASSAARPTASTRERLVTMMDACDSASFAVGTGNPEQCTRAHGVTFDKFIAELQRTGIAGAWHFAPPQMTARRRNARRRESWR